MFILSFDFLWLISYEKTHSSQIVYNYLIINNQQKIQASWIEKGILWAEGDLSIGETHRPVLITILFCIYREISPPASGAHRAHGVPSNRHIRPTVSAARRRRRAVSPLNRGTEAGRPPEACSAHRGSRDASGLKTRHKRPRSLGDDIFWIEFSKMLRLCRTFCLVLLCACFVSIPALLRDKNTQKMGLISQNLLFILPQKIDQRSSGRLCAVTISPL